MEVGHPVLTGSQAPQIIPVSITCDFIVLLVKATLATIRPHTSWTRMVTHDMAHLITGCINLLIFKLTNSTGFLVMVPSMRHSQIVTNLMSKCLKNISATFPKSFRLTDCVHMRIKLGESPKSRILTKLGWIDPSMG